MAKLTAVNVAGRNTNVTAAIIRISVLSLLVNSATFFESSAIAFIALLSARAREAISRCAREMERLRRFSSCAILL